MHKRNPTSQSHTFSTNLHLIPAIIASGVRAELLMYAGRHSEAIELANEVVNHLSLWHTPIQFVEVSIVGVSQVALQLGIPDLAERVVACVGQWEKCIEYATAAALDCRHFLDSIAQGLSQPNPTFQHREFFVDAHLLSRSPLVTPVHDGNLNNIWAPDAIQL